MEISPGLRETDLPRRAVEKARAEPVLQVAYASTDRRLRHAEALCSAGEAFRLNDGDERADVFKTIGADDPGPELVAAGGMSGKNARYDI